MIKEIAISDARWNKIVKSIDCYDVFYLKEYAMAFQSQGAGIPVLVLYEDESSRAMNVILIRDICSDNYFDEEVPTNEYYDITTPYGYGGFIGKIEDEKKVANEWEQYCINKGYISEFVRFELKTSWHKYFKGTIESKTHNVVRDLNLDIDHIWMDFKQKVRKNVKRAQQYNLEIIVDESGELLDDFLVIYHGTMERTNANKESFFTKKFFKTINKMVGNCVYFHVKYKNKIISSELVIYGADTCYSFLGGTDSVYFHLRPNDYLKFEIIKWAQNKGLKNFVLGGGYGTDDGIFQYKTSLAPNGIVNFYTGRRVYNQEIYNKLVKIRKGKSSSFDENSGFFPIYRG